MIRLLFIALGFLTVLPVPIKRTFKAVDMGRSMAFFPLTGAIIGGILIFADTLLSHIFPRNIGDFMLVAFLALITGGLHLDGLADTFDGLAGGRSREEALSIMKDSRVGAIGVVGLIFVIGLKYTALLSVPQDLKHPALLAMPSLSRWSMVLMAWLSPYARGRDTSHISPTASIAAGNMGSVPSGTGRDFVETLSTLSFFTATSFAIAIAITALGWKGGAAIVCAGIITLAAAAYFRKRLGGVTGDVLGAVNEINEVLALLILVIINQLQPGAGLY